MLSIDLLLQGRRGTCDVDETSGRMVNPVVTPRYCLTPLRRYSAETQGREVADPQAWAFLTAI